VSIAPFSNHLSSYRTSATRDFSPNSAQQLLQRLLAESIVLSEDWENLPAETRGSLSECDTTSELLQGLASCGVITDYQAGRIEAGTLFGLKFDHYRVLDRIGAGGMGVVFRAEHSVMRRQVAIKVLPASFGDDAMPLRRFLNEMRAVAQLNHPNIVGALDAGRLVDPEGNTPTLHYFVMEYVPGEDLEEFVQQSGALSPEMSCDLVHQIAAALEEAHKHRLIHRDIKPSNIRITAEGQAKLLDFGLARCGSTRHTQPGTVLGTLEFMAPEQARDAAAVDIRADIYGLGGTLYWCLTGKLPFKHFDNIAEEIVHRVTQEAPSARALRPEISEELDAVVAKMMALKPEDRYQTPHEVLTALVPFLANSYRESMLSPLPRGGDHTSRPLELNTPNSKNHDILIVDDEGLVRDFCRFALTSPDAKCDAAADGLQALEAVRKKQYDLVVLDVDMPNMKGPEVCRQLRQHPPYPHLKVLMMSGRATGDELAEVMMAGADDFLVKPLSVMQLRARVTSLLRLKQAQDRSDLLNRHLLAANQQLETNLNARDSDLVHARNALVLALGELVNYRDAETGAHLIRLQEFCRALGEEAARMPAFAGAIDANYLDMLECCVPLHDIGKVALPDHILMKPGKLTNDERIIMQTHTTIGAETLKKVAEKHGFAHTFLQMSIEIARHHHERFDGAGYPDRLAGEAIPLSARITAIADVYDALRSRRVYKPALSHDTVMRMMLHEFTGHFDPMLLKVFERCSGRFEQIYREAKE